MTVKAQFDLYADDSVFPPCQFAGVVPAQSVGVLLDPLGQHSGAGGRRIDVQQVGHQALDLVLRDDHIARRACPSSQPNSIAKPRRNGHDRPLACRSTGRSSPQVPDR